MALRDLETRVAQLEKQMVQLQATAMESEMPSWEKSLKRFADDEDLLAIFSDAMKLREAERKKGASLKDESAVAEFEMAEDLKKRVEALEAQLADIRTRLVATESKKKDWRRAVEKYLGDEDILAVFAEGKKLREAERQKARQGRSKRPKP